MTLFSSLSSLPLKCSCKACTFSNPYNKPFCEVCCPVLSLSNLNELNDATDLNFSIGSVFFPLRPCNKRKANHVVQVLDSDHSSERASLKPKFPKKATNVSENTDSRTASSSFKILNYNVWFREDLELHKRMKVIGDLVQLHSPDAISLISGFTLPYLLWFLNLCAFVLLLNLIATGEESSQEDLMRNQEGVSSHLFFNQGDEFVEEDNHDEGKGIL
ncbi:hypothetical protein Fmac_026360 [Flemingia macrophylla]|uniref:Uncharacterized protein n=1 Tax=Flemingia macrophylla TaxID=520843 RepID=A0ABD1LET8_9FABA